MLKAQFQKDREKERRRARFARADDAPDFNAGYSRFVRWMRILLPVAALVIIAVLFTVTGFREKPVIPTQEEAKVPPSVGKNELLNPHFESVDQKEQPYFIDADRAVQGEKEESLVLLENPRGEMKLSSGQKAYMQAKSGAYRQDTNRILLEGDVKLSHDNGYALQTQKLDVDLKGNFASSDLDVLVTGPDGRIEAKGLQADGETGDLIFAGPAKMTIRGAALKGFNVGGI